MIEHSVLTPNSADSPELSKADQSSRLKQLLGIGIVLNAAIWGATALLLQSLSPTYTSQGAAIIPGVSAQGSVDLSETGINASSGQSAYGYLLSVDPRENYQYIAQTDSVRAEAAAALGISVEEFGEPAIWLNEGTTIMQFQASGATPEEAQQKAWAFYEAWGERISELRNEEAERQIGNIEHELQRANQSLDLAQEKISDFRGRSPLKIASQIEQVAGQVENLRVQRANLLVNQEGLDARFRQLSNQLSFSAEQAGDALVLLDDKIFQSSLQNYSSAIADLEVLTATWAANSPLVLAAQDRKQSAEQGMLQRSRAVLGKPIELQFLARLDLGGEGRRDLVQEMVRLQAERQGLGAQLQTLDQQIGQFEARLKQLTQEEFILSRLERDAKISESIFAEGLARLDVNKPDYATYYPPLQLIEKPMMPGEEDENSQSRMILLGALAFSVISTTGLVMFGWGQTPNRNIFSYASADPEKRI